MKLEKRLEAALKSGAKVVDFQLSAQDYATAQAEGLGGQYRGLPITQAEGDQSVSRRRESYGGGQNHRGWQNQWVSSPLP